MKGAERKLKGRAEVQLVVPTHTEEVLIVRVDGNQTIGVADVDFGEQRSTAFFLDEINGVLQAGVG